MLCMPKSNFTLLNRGSWVAKDGRGTRVQSVERAAQLLLTVARGTTDNSGKALAEELDLAVPTAHHLLSTLVDQGLLMRTDRSRYVLGPQVAILANAFYSGDSAPEAFVAALRQLATTTGETAYLAAWRGAEVRLLAAIEGDHSLRVSVPSEPYYDAHARATGKLLLAFASEETRESYLRTHPLRPRTPRTLIDPDQFHEELKLTRERGYATDLEEYEQGISCISVPVLDRGVAIVAYSLSVPSSRFEDKQSSLLAAAKSVADSVSRSVQGRSVPEDGEE
jgi:IclR family transcriptional regulator, acetate operon repressor